MMPGPEKPESRLVSFRAGVLRDAPNRRVFMPAGSHVIAITSACDFTYRSGIIAAQYSCQYEGAPHGSARDHLEKSQSPQPPQIVESRSPRRNLDPVYRRPLRRPRE
jgi:hypothetical protein